MAAFLTEVRSVLAPGASTEHGPLAPVLVSMTVVTGLVDAFSYLVLGHVFVANVTGNVVFLGFALAGAPGFSITDSVTAMGAFALGAIIGGRLSAWHSDHRGRLHSSAALFQAVLIGIAVILAVLTTTNPVPGDYRYALIITLALSMGLQNAAARKLAVPDLTTTVLTLTITGIAADSALGGGTGSHLGRRIIPVIALLIGGLAGAELVLNTHIYWPLVIAFIAVLAGGVTTYLLGRPGPAWVHGGGTAPPRPAPAPPAD
jgi:uncharacterized membrane protein YoaK (UPF0700 family)